MDDPAISERVAHVVAELRTMLAGSDDAHRLFRTSARAAVVAQHRAGDEFYRLEPLHFERTGRRRGQRLADGETSPHEWRYGFDAQGRLRTVEADNYSACFTYEPGRIFERRWIGTSLRLRVARLFLVDATGRCHTLVGINSSGEWTADVYEYDGPRVVTFASYIAGGPAPWTTGWYEVTWSTAGRVERIGFSGHPDVPPLYQAPRRRLGLVLAEAQRLLIERIPMRLAGVAPPDRVYGLALGFNQSSRDELMPPLLGLLFESNRSFQLSQTGLDLDELWNPMLELTSPIPQEFPSPALDDEDLLALGTEVAMLAHSAGNIDAVVRCHLRVAKALNGLDWRQVMPVTDDFIVFPVDYEANRYLDLINASVPAVRARRLRAAGLLPAPE
jgi:hypothetical protein